MARWLLIILLRITSAQFNFNPAIAELNEATTLSWQIPAGGLGTGSSFIVISPAGSSALLLTPPPPGDYLAQGDYAGRIEFSGSYASRNITFTLRNISSADAGTYGCGNGAVTDVISDCGQMLVVLGEPTKPPVPVSSTTPVFTRQVTLTCTSTSTSLPTGHGLTLTYTWERDGTIVTPNPGSSFTFAVTSHDPENFRCRAVERRGLASDWSDVYRMEPEYGPYQESLTPPGLSYTVRENQDTISPISCSANCKPACTYRWENNGTTFSNTDVLDLGQSPRSQTGLYRCRSNNPHGSIYTPAVSVNVQYAASISEFTLNSTTGPVTVSEGDTVTLKCRVDSNPLSTIRLMNGNQELKREDNSLSETMISQITCRQRGNYSCSAGNSVGPSVSSEVNLAVNCSPRPDEMFPVNYQSASGLGSNVTLWMSVLSYPVPTFTWSRSNSSSQDLSGSLSVLSDISVNISLTLTSLGREDFGFYNLTLSNGIGEDTVITFEVVLQGPPDPPTDVSVTSDVSSVHVTWLRGYNRGLEQTFTVEYSLDKTVWTDGGTVTEVEDLEYYKTVISGLEPSTQYFVRVRAHNQLGYSPFTDPVSATTDVRHAEISRTDNLGTGLGIGFGVCLPVIVVLVVVVVLLYRRIQATAKSQSKNREQLQTDRTYEDVDPTAPVDRSTYDGLDNNTTRTLDYAELKLYENSRI